jgi:hypothetical protein
MNTILFIIVLLLIIFFIILNKYIECQNYHNYYIENTTQYVQNNYELNNNFKNIFCFWNSEIIPPLINECLKNFKKKLPEWNVILLNEKTIHILIDETEFPKNYNKLTIPQKSDWIRLILLYKYGGLWMDSSIIINVPSEINYMYDKVFKENYQLAGYSYCNLLYTFDNYYAFESWFMISNKNSEIVYKWLKEYEYAIEIGFENYQINIMSFHRITNYVWNNYWIVYTCFQNVIMKNKELYKTIFINDCRKDFFSYTTGVDVFDVFHMLLDKNMKNIKLMNGERQIINKFFLKDIIDKYFLD